MLAREFNQPCVSTYYLHRDEAPHDTQHQHYHLLCMAWQRKTSEWTPTEQTKLMEIVESKAEDFPSKSHYLSFLNGEKIVA